MCWNGGTILELEGGLKLGLATKECVFCVIIVVMGGAEDRVKPLYLLVKLFIGVLLQDLQVCVNPVRV